MELSSWSLTLRIISSSSHSVAIACTVFRLMYRWYTAHFWWEDGWAAFALVADVPCLVSAWMEIPWPTQEMPHIDLITNWMAALGLTCVLWACRISILFSIVRIAGPSQQLRRIALFVGSSFIVMWAALMGQKIQICLASGCIFTAPVGISQLITDVISDSVLVILPVYLLRRTKITHRQRIMIFSVFSASLLITPITIFHSVVLFTAQSNGVIVIGHTKTALALIVCNLLVIVTFIYRLRRRGTAGDLDAKEEDPITFTSVDLNTGLSESAPDRHTTMTTTAMQVSTVSGSFCSTAGSVVVEEKVEGTA